MDTVPRVAFFTDSFFEVNGVARTSRQLEESARKTNRPFFCIHGTDSRKTPLPCEHGLRFPLQRGRTSFRVECDLEFDPNLWRYRRAVLDAVSEFRADVIHVTSPGDVGFLGAFVASRLKIPLVASWHTNVHSYAGVRLQQLLSILPLAWKQSAGRIAEEQVLRFILLFYELADVVLAPNAELVQMLADATAKPSFLMLRGVRTDLFSPAKRTANDHIFRIGFVGRLSPEKNVRLLATIDQTLERRGFTGFEIVVVGDGKERQWLESNLKHGRFTG